MKPWWKFRSSSSERPFVTTSSNSARDWFNDFEREAFRLETLDDYSKSGGVDAYRAFLAGEPQPEDYATADWMTTVGNAVQSGRRIYRVHILARPLTDYLRFELSWGYRRNMMAGRSSSSWTRPTRRTRSHRPRTSGSSMSGSSAR